MTENPHINSYAIQCFRDTGDLDYIGARIMYRAQLDAQFLWFAQQAIEKYLKCILALNGITTHKLNHNLQKALSRINERAGFAISLNDPETEIFNHLNDFGANRYLESSWHISGHDLLKLDMLVWHLRQYCQLMDDIKQQDIIIPKRKIILKAIENSWNNPPQQAYLFHGKLEKILKNKKHPARAGLVWKNMRFTAQNRKQVSFHNRMHSENSPLDLHPGLFKYIDPIVQISSEGRKLYSKLSDEYHKENQKPE